MSQRIHRSECAYAGLPLSQRGQLPWPAPQNDSNMCICTEPAASTVDLSVVDYLRANSDVEFEFVALGGMRRAGDPPRYFIADQRIHERNGQDELWVCIHQWTSSPVSLLRNLGWVNRPYYRPEIHKIWVFEARNKGQIAAWLEDVGYNPDYMGKRHAPMPAQERIIVNSRERKMAQEQAIIERAQARIDRLASLPAEPTTEDPDGALVVWFRHQFNMGSREYTYAAVKASDGKWYTTGPASPKGYSWDELIEWHLSEINIDATMWVATEWEPIA